MTDIRMAVATLRDTIEFADEPEFLDGTAALDAIEEMVDEGTWAAFISFGKRWTVVQEVVACLRDYEGCAGKQYQGWLTRRDRALQALAEGEDADA